MLPMATPVCSKINTNMQTNIITGDCLEEMRKLEDGSHDFIFTSPPYNVHEKGIGNFPKNNPIWKRAALSNGYPSHSDDMPFGDYANWQRQCLDEMWRILSHDGILFYNHKPRIKKGVLFHPMTLNPDLPLRQIIIWNRSGGHNFNRRAFLSVHEYILVYAKPAFEMAKGKRGVADVWTVAPATKNDHPAPFPIELPRRALEATGKRRVLDPFCGSGSTGCAAKEYGAEIFTGIELHAPFAEAAAKRVAKS